MKAQFNIKRGATKRSIQTILTSSSDDMNTADSASFRMKKPGATTYKVDDTAIIVSKSETSLTVRYDWKPEDLDELGTFNGNFIVTFSDNKQDIYPSNGYHTIEVQE